MSQDEVPTDLMGYAEMAQDALRGVVKSALKRAASPEGLPGEHHLYISFRTRAPGVSIPADLLARYPDEITIVMQHQYRDLAPGETFFSVTLSFGGQPKHLSVPYAAVTRFTDPYAQFGLEFQVPEPPATAPEPEPESVSEDSAPKIVSLDHFRKK